MERPDENDEKYQFIEDDCHLTDYYEYWEDVDEYSDQLESEKKELIEALKAVESVTKDETLPLFRVINQIAFKSLKAINKLKQ